MPDRAHFLPSSSFIEYQSVEFEHVSRMNFAKVFRVFAQVIQVFQVFSSSSLAKFKFVLVSIEGAIFWVF